MHWTQTRGHPLLVTMRSKDLEIDTISFIRLVFSTINHPHVFPLCALTLTIAKEVAMFSSLSRLERHNYTQKPKGERRRVSNRQAVHHLSGFYISTPRASEMIDVVIPTVIVLYTHSPSITFIIVYK